MERNEESKGVVREGRGRRGGAEGEEYKRREKRREGGEERAEKSMQPPSYTLSSFLPNNRGKDTVLNAISHSHTR